MDKRKNTYSANNANAKKKRLVITLASLQVFTAVEENGVHVETEETFNASNGWFDNFRNRIKLHY